MKKFLVLMFVGVFCLLGVQSALALPYTPSAGDISTFYQVTPGTLNGAVGSDGSFQVTISDEGGGWGDIQIGRDATIEGVGSAFYSGSWADLSAYDTYELTITNTSATDWFMANIYLNTGWTDPGYNETDYYYQNGWTSVAPGTSVSLVLDLKNAVSSGGAGGSGHAIDNLGHVSSLGFNIGTNFGSGDAAKNLEGKATSIPDASTVALLGSAMIFGALFIRRRRYDV